MKHLPANQALLLSNHNSSDDISSTTAEHPNNLEFDMWSLIKHRTKQVHGKERVNQTKFGTVEECDAAIAKAEAVNREKRQMAETKALLKVQKEADKNFVQTGIDARKREAIRRKTVKSLQDSGETIPPSLLAAVHDPCPTTNEVYLKLNGRSKAAKALQATLKVSSQSSGGTFLKVDEDTTQLSAELQEIYDETLVRMYGSEEAARFQITPASQNETRNSPDIIQNSPELPALEDPRQQFLDGDDFIGFSSDLADVPADEVEITFQLSNNTRTPNSRPTYDQIFWNNFPIDPELSQGMNRHLY